MALVAESLWPLRIFSLIGFAYGLRRVRNRTETGSQLGLPLSGSHASSASAKYSDVVGRAAVATDW